MPNIRRRLIQARAALSPGMRFVLETGRVPDNWGDLDDGVDIFRAARSGSAAAAPWWADHGPLILAEWIAANPGTRPWAWWKFEAPSPRRIVRGTPLADMRPWPTGMEWWRHRFGVPGFIHVRPRGAALPRIESEAAYLRRLVLLTIGEPAALDAADFEPEEINPFYLDEAELDLLRRKGTHQ